MKKEQGKQILWYIRRNGSERGPFPSGTLRRFLIIGRVKLNDQVSRDKANWKRVSETPEVIPPELRQAMKEGREQELLSATLREDERSGRERRLAESAQERERRRLAERRRQEMELQEQYRTAKTDLREQSDRRRLPIAALAVVATLVAGVLGYGLYLGTPDAIPEPDCSAQPTPGVNWRNCRFDRLVAESADLRGALLNNAVLPGARLSAVQLMGADLQYADISSADLSYADLTDALLKGAGLRNADLTNSRFTGADLSFADLTGASIGGAIFSGARFDNAIWIDGSSCREGSVGGCAKAQADQGKDSVR